MGLCLSYTRILEITREPSNASISQYNCNKVFAPSVLRKGLFTIIAKDNIDHNASSSTAVKHYQGTSMTVMQCLTAGSAGEQQTFLSNIDFSNQQSKTSDLKMPSFYIQVLPHYFKKEKLYAPLCTMYSDNTIYLEGILEETAWLEKVSSSSVFDSWSKHHSQMNRFSVLVPGVNAIPPLIPEPVHTLIMQYHCMKIIMQTVNFLNPGQIPVDVSDQPVYALTKELQWRKPEEFGENFYFAMFGGLHLEHALLLIHGELIQGSGLYEILHINNLSIIGTGAVVRANHIKQARYCLQVALCNLPEGSAISPIEWLESKAKISQMCNYWHLIMKSQIEILLFIRSIRESNFMSCVRSLMKWLFASDHYNYARWASVHLRDLTGVHLTCPDVFREFNDGHFSFQKTKRKFSKMALDQCHEQNNELIKGISGATHLLNRNDETSLERWETSTPELARLITEFEESFDNKRNECDTQHHEPRQLSNKDFLPMFKRCISVLRAILFSLVTLKK